MLSGSAIRGTDVIAITITTAFGKCLRIDAIGPRVTIDVQKQCDGIVSLYLSASNYC